MTTQIIFSVFISFFVMMILGPFVIPALRKMKVGNTEREELESHQIKTGTPTMGGIMIIVSVIVSTLIFGRGDSRIIAILLVTVAFGVIGFIDDYLKVVLRRSDGLLPKQKFAMQLVVAILFAIYMGKAHISFAILVPFTGHTYFSIGFLAVPVMILAMLGTVNGVNFTDGVDGLVSTVTLPVAAFFLISSIRFGITIGVVIAAVIGALLGFLVFNVHPAKVFMGDTGSLALGGFVSATAYMLQQPLFILLVGLIYWVEIFSVIIQVSYFKKTGGKRIFRMAPIHHHFELGGWSETKVVAIFAIITTLLCLLSLIGIV